MQIALYIGIILLSYVIGSISFGLLIVKMKTGKDIREVESGRTGGTNAMRAAGFWAGFATAMLDIFKGTVCVWLAAWVAPDQVWLHVLAPIASILGHNYSIFMPEFDEQGKFVKLRGGAGGAPALGGAVGLWAPSVLIILPLGMLTFFTIGIASITTMAVAIFAIIVFAIRAAQELSPWLYVWYGIAAELLLIWALRPNLVKLFSGKERVVKYSLNGWWRAKKEGQGDGNQ